MGEEIKIWDYRKLKIRKTLGRGAFGIVYLAHCDDPEVANPVVMKVMHNSLAMGDNSRRLFLKEASILSGLHHENIVRIYGVCVNPLTIIMEYVVFDFEPFGKHSKVNTLDAFLSEIAQVPKSEEHRFDQLIPTIAIEVTRGIAHLHDKEIAHRDLKPMNILISNQHYCSLEDRCQMRRIKAQRPIVCKLADFGESRSQRLQTNGLNDPDTSQVFRGTIAFMAPEILLPEGMVQGRKLSLDDLKRVDIWALGLVFYCLINPADTCPYERDGYNHQMDIMNLQRQRKRPSCDPQYLNKQSTVWVRIRDTFHACTNHNSCGRPRASEVLVMLNASTGPASGNHSSLMTNVVPLRQAFSGNDQGTAQWYTSAQGESDVKYIYNKFKAIAHNKVDMSRNKHTQNLSMSFQHNGKQWQVSFPANFPKSNASLYADGVFYAVVGGDTVKTSARSVISAITESRDVLRHENLEQPAANQWYDGNQGEAALRYVLNELTNIADSEVKMSRKKSTHDVKLSFAHNGHHWEIRFPPNFPISNATLSNGEFCTTAGGDSISTAALAIISTITQAQPTRAAVARVTADQWYAGDQGEAALRYVVQELTNISDNDVQMSRKKDTHDVTLSFERNVQHWEIAFPSNFPRSNANLFKNREFYAIAGGDSLENAVSEIINRIQSVDHPFAGIIGNSVSVTGEQWYAGHSGEDTLRYVFDTLRRVADNDVKMSRKTDTHDITLSFRRREREWEINFPYNFPRSSAGVSTNGEDYTMIGGDTVENALIAIKNYITSMDPSRPAVHVLEMQKPMCCII